MIPTPIAWECPAHDGFLASMVELHWPPRGRGIDPTKPKKEGKGRKAGRKRR